MAIIKDGESNGLSGGLESNPMQSMLITSRLDPRLDISRLLLYILILLTFRNDPIDLNRIPLRSLIVPTYMAIHFYFLIMPVVEALTFSTPPLSIFLNLYFFRAFR